MKQFVLGTLAFLSLGSNLGALDSEKMAALEKEWAPIMKNNDGAALQVLESSLGSSVATADAKTHVKAGIVAHNLARALPGKGWPSKAVERLKGPSKGSEAELALVATVYLGSSTSLVANDDANPVMKILQVNQGWDLLTQAVEKGGEASFLPRFLRASVGQALPEFFGKYPTVVADTRALEAWAQAHPGRLGDDLLAQIALIQANTLKKTKDLKGAIAAWKKTVALDPSRKGPGKAAQAALDLYDE